MNKRVVVTGLGVVSSVGIGKNTFWNNLINGKSGISKISLFDTSKFNRHYAGEIKNFSPGDFMPSGITKFLGRASQFAVAATKLALEDANLSLKQVEEKTGILVGTTLPEGIIADSLSQSFSSEKWNKITNKMLMNIFPPAIPRNMGYQFKAESINMLIPTACAAGNYAIGYGFDLIKKGEIDIAIAGGTEAISRLIYQGFQKLLAMAPETCAPFDRNRKGMLLGEGAGILILESLAHAQNRDVPIYAEILGYGLSCDASHITIPSQTGIRKAMEKAIKNAGISKNSINYISAHGTGTSANDKAESAAINEVFGKTCPRIPVSSIKSMLGHCMGAASSIEAVTCCLAIQNNKIPPTINFETPDPECDIDCVPNKSRQVKLNAVLNNGFAFGGNNCCVVFSK